MSGMRSLNHLFDARKQVEKKMAQSVLVSLDAKTVFFLFTRIVRDYYGKRGGMAIHPLKYENQILFIKVASPLWANELLVQQEEFCKQLNQEIGSEAVQSIRIVHGLHAD